MDIEGDGMSRGMDDCCYECRGLGDDYGYDENGDLVSMCDDCPMNPCRGDDGDD